MPIYFGEAQITKIYKGEAQLDRVIIADAIVDIYTFGDGNTTTTTPPTTTPDPTPICCICTQSGNDVICETVTGEYAELCNEPNASPLCPDETCNCYET